MSKAFFDLWVERYLPETIKLEQIKENLKQLAIETPSWGYADSGTRFHVFKQAGAARAVSEKIDDAAQVHKYTGLAPFVALHIPWDQVDDWVALRQYTEEQGIQIGAINPNLFQADLYKLGSLTHHDKAVREQALDHLVECIEIMEQTGSQILSLWLPDGTNYPGQADFRSRKGWLEENLAAAYAKLADDMILLLEYKFFEPAFYSTDLPDWGTATLLAKKLGQKAKTLVDLGHHPMGTNIEQIVAFLLDEEKLGGFHFNNRKYADDDLTTGSINPYELFLIFHELNNAPCGTNIAYMIDQSHNIKPKIEAMIQSVLNIHAAYAKSLLVDRQALNEAQRNGDVVAAEEVLLRAYRTDVRPLLEVVRQEMDVPLCPITAFRQSGYLQNRIEKSREG